MSAAVDRLTRAVTYDIIHLDLIHMVRYGEAAARHNQHRLIYNWHNIESELMQRYSSTVSSRARSWYARLTASKLARVERDVLRTALGHVVCSQRESQELHRIQPSARVEVIENGVDTASFSTSAEPPARKIVFVGLMDYYSNIEAATSFTQRIWPRIRERLPDLSLWIVGANPVPAVLDLGKLAGVTVTGTVEDVRPYYRDALAAIVPLRTGSGTRLKILEAMAAGVPVVSTPLGAEGLAVTPGEDILFAEPDDADSWLHHLTHLAEESAVRQRIVDHALRLVRTRYDWEALGRKLCETYEDWLGQV
jgi:glycosyltransferase involved in cell wall biosynthesis